MSGIQVYLEIIFERVPKHAAGSILKFINSLQLLVVRYPLIGLTEITRNQYKMHSNFTPEYKGLL